MMCRKILLFVFALFLISCDRTKPVSENNPAKAPDRLASRITAPLRHSIVLEASTNEEDIPTNEYLLSDLKPVRDNFKRINSISNWTFSDTVDLPDESLEGGEAEYFYSGQTLERIITRHFGENYQTLTEFYLLKGDLSFVFEKTYRYNRPLFYDSAAMKEGNDNQVFDFDKSAIEELRSYFLDGRMIHQSSNQDCGSPFPDDYLAGEQKRIKKDFVKLMGMKTK